MVITHSSHSKKLSTKVKQVHGSNSISRTLVVIIFNVSPSTMFAGYIVWSQFYLLDLTKRLKHTVGGWRALNRYCRRMEGIK